MSNPLLIKSYAALAAVSGHLIIKAGIGGVAAAAGPTEPSIGFSDAMGAEAGGMLDVVQVGLGEVRLGGNVSFGDPLTSDAQGRAVKAVPVPGSVIRIVGIAQADGVENDIIPALAAPSVLATPAP
jgi:hypothetical protein